MLLKKQFNPLVLIFPFLILLTTLSFGGSISGSLLDDEGNPIQELITVAYSTNGNDWEFGQFQDSEYTFNNLNEGAYFIFALGAEQESWYCHIHLCWFYPNRLCVARMALCN